MRVLLVCLLLTLLCVNYMNAKSSGRSFAVDMKNDRFLKDGKPFRYIAGSFHYFRAHPDTWRRKLRTMRAAGLNAVSTYVEWSLHNPKNDTYVWTGIADLERFIREAESEDLLVILRPGPYICAERDMGGLPYWLLNKYPSIKLRVSDKNYLFEVRKWYSVLMPRITPYLYGNGGPIILVQIENEYGFFKANDGDHLKWLRNETLKYVINKAVLFTSDTPHALEIGHVDGAVATINLIDTNDVANAWELQRKVQPHGPFVISEFYSGWLTHWSRRMARIPSELIAKTFIQLLDVDANVNLYMFYGGTNFGFTAGANDDSSDGFLPQITSYDYDAPMDEAGDPTSKYHKLREIIGRYLPMPNIPIPAPVPKKHYGSVQLDKYCSILSDMGRKYLATGLVTASIPKTFEALNQYSGLVLYEAMVRSLPSKLTFLKAAGIRDRAYVYVNDELMSVVSRESPHHEWPLMVSNTKDVRLQLLVENQGRINYGRLINDFKGIVDNVLLDDKVLFQWNMTKYPFESYQDIQTFREQVDAQRTQTTGCHVQNTGTIMRMGPTIFHGVVHIDESDLGDTYIDTNGWGKGVLFVNGENLGRYWPKVGPQITLYVPQEMLIAGENHIVLIEYENASPTNEITLTDEPNLDGRTHGSAQTYNG